jgi:hypothetical protein
VKAFLKVLVLWMALLALPLQGFASATMSPCAPLPAAAQHDHDHAATAGDNTSCGEQAHDGHTGAGMQSDQHHPASQHHAGKCASCATCGACMSMVPSFVAVLPLSTSPSITIPFDLRTPPSVDLALPERPPRA